MKQLFILSFLSLLLSTQIFGQAKTSKINFKQDAYDYGTINESDGAQTHEFEFTNTGDAPLIINNVTASCGCTTPEWTKSPILKGKSGKITVSFDPKNRPGPFSKTITVTSNAPDSPKKLYITGEVTEAKKTIDDLYQYTVNGLKFKSNHLAMTKVYKNSSKTENLELFNPTKKPITVEFDNIPKHITFEKTKVMVKPNEKTSIKVTYFGSKVDAWGFTTNRIQMIVDGNRESKNRITISADLQEDFSKLTKEQLLNAPKATFESTMFDLGNIKKGERKSYKFNFKNEGKTDLIIRSINTSCGCTVSDAETTVIKPGQSSSINATFNPKGQSGRQNKTITVFTNDPKNSQITLRVKGTVENQAKKN